MIDMDTYNHYDEGAIPMITASCRGTPIDWVETPYPVVSVFPHSPERGSSD